MLCARYRFIIREQRMNKAICGSRRSQKGDGGLQSYEKSFAG